MEPLTGGLSEIIKELGLYEGLKLEFLRRDFSTIFPPPMGEHIHPSSLRRGQLLVVVDSHVWLNELRLHENEMLKRLSGYGVESIRFKLGRVYSKKGRGTAARPSTADCSIPEEVLNDVESKIRDPHVRESLLGAIRSSMRRRR
ncbi:MAG TPA: DUF721 domain-containing protein [Nitrospirae bacterium]|nr:DUF721 domain-containing protein [Nitrospirota bacterium]